MDKGTTNLVVDAMLFLALTVIVGIGLLMEFVLPPGREIVASHGRGVWFTFLGWDRHEWGDLHLAAGCLFLLLLVVHIALHWKGIVCLARRLVPNRAGRIVIASAFATASALLLVAPLVVQPEMKHRGPGRGAGHVQRHSMSCGSSQGAHPYGAARSLAPRGHVDTRAGGRHRRVLLRGRWTLQDAAEYAGVSVTELRQELGLPPGESGHMRLGRVRREHGLRMADVRATVAKLARAHHGGRQP